jgi:adenylate cyclase
MSLESAPNPIHAPTGRKLVVVVHADMVGYSRLIGLDDVGTLERLRALRQELIDPAIAEHGGRVVNTGGDSQLVVFDTVDGAVRCALMVQRQVPLHEDDVPADRAIRFRIGINIGDVIPDGSDIYGDVVNVAARLQTECPPGGICVSRGVRDHVRLRLDLAFEGLGELSLKNIAQPIEAFVIRPGQATAGPVERALVHREALPLPDKPSIAVLAFTNMSGDPEQEYFSDGIADDIITELARSRSLFVIARNSSFSYKGRAVDIKQIARELGVRYLLEGGVRRSGPRLRVTAQLIDAQTGNHIWADRYDRSVEDLFAVQDEIAAAVVMAIGPAVADAELQRVLRKPPESLGAWEAYQRGLWHVGRATLADAERAKELFQRSITLDPVFARAYGALARVCMNEALTYGKHRWEDVSEQALGWATRAIALDQDDPELQALLGNIAYLTGNREESRERVSLALAIDPNSPGANFIKAVTLIHDGHTVEGRIPLMTAVRFDPRGPYNPIYMVVLAFSHYIERDYEGTVIVAKRASARYPADPRLHRSLAAALGQLGRTDEARAVLNDAIRTSAASADFSVRHPAVPPEDHEHMLEGLRKAGWQG